MAMWNVPNRVITVEGENGYELYGDFQCDSASDLSTTYEGVTIAKGSTCQIVTADEPTFVTMDSEGSWNPAQS